MKTAKSSTKTNAQLNRKVASITKRIYASYEIICTPENKMTKVLVPFGSLIIAPDTMSKKEFDSFRLKWVNCMERKLKKSKSNKKNK